MDTFSTSIQSITDQLLHHETVVREHINTFSLNVRREINEKMQKIEDSLDDLHHRADSNKAAGDVLELRISELKHQTKEQEKRTSEAFDQVHTDIAALRHELPVEEKVQTGSRLSVKKSPTRPGSNRRHHRSSYGIRNAFESAQVIDIKPAVDWVDASVVRRLQMEVQELRTLIPGKRAAPPEPSNMDQVLVAVNQRIDQCAKKTDLDQLTQCFIASGSHCSTSAPSALAFVGKPPVRQATAHVKVITGECLKRPVMAQGKVGRAVPRPGGNSVELGDL
jgi:hypothetical protein